MGTFYPIKIASGVGQLENVSNKINDDVTYAVEVEASEKSVYYIFVA